MGKKPTYEELQLKVKELERQLGKEEHLGEVLHESKEKFQKIASSAQDAIIMMDEEGKISFWNEAAEKIFGYRRQEVLDRR